MDGIYLINKPVNMTSFDVIRHFKNIDKNIKIGHAGTLDPFASGLLVILTGHATKLSSFLINDNKTYEGVITFGTSTETYDLTGEVTNTLDNFELKKEELLKIFEEFKGEISQKPPIYSAIKQEGRKLYQYARQNIDIKIPKRDVVVEKLELIDIKGNNVSFITDVSKGTYIRSLANDIGVKLNIPSHLSKLNRTKSGIFNLSDAYELNDINALSKPTITTEEYAKSLNNITVKPYMERLVLNGVILDKRQTNLKGIFSVFNEEGKLLAIYQPYKKDQYKPLLVYKGNKDESN